MEQKSIATNSIYNVIKTISSIVFPLVTFPYVSRVLLPENVGKINFGLSIVSYFSLVASLGITTYAIRECSSLRNNKDQLSIIASQIWSINIFTTIISYIALTITLICYRKLYNYRSIIVIQSLSILATTLGADWLNSAMEDFKFITIRTVAFQFISLFLMFIFVHVPEDYMKYALISLVSSAGANVVNIWYRTRYCKLRFTYAIQWRKHFVPIMYLFVMLLAQTIFNSVDSTMLGLIHGDRAVGIYSTAHKIENLVRQLVTSLLWVIMPRMSYYFSEGNYDNINSFLRKILGFNALIGLPCGIGVFMLSDEIILTISGNGFSEASGVLKILMIGFLFSIFGGGFLGNSILLPSKKEKTFMAICCIAAVVNVITNYMFIPKYGPIAAAGTTSLCAFIMFICLLFSVDKQIRIERFSRLFISPILGCIGIVVVCILCEMISDLWMRTIISLLLSLVVYFFIVYLCKNELLYAIICRIKQKQLRR